MSIETMPKTMPTEKPENFSSEEGKEKKEEKREGEKKIEITQVESEIKALENEYNNLYKERDKYANSLRMKEVEKQIKEKLEKRKRLKEGEEKKTDKEKEIAQIKSEIEELEKKYDELYEREDRYDYPISQRIKRLEEQIRDRYEKIGALEKEKKALEKEKKEEKEKEENIEEINLKEKRNNLAQVLNRSRRFLFRPKKEEIEKARKEYEEALKHKIEKAEEELEEKIKELGLTEDDLNELETKMKNGEELPEKLKEYQRLIAEFALFQQEEQTKLRESMENPEDKTLGDKFKKFWLKHRKLRMILSYSLTGLGIVSIVTGFAPGILISGTGRAALTGTGTAMATAGTWDWLRSKWGEEKNIKGIDYKKYKEMKKEKMKETKKKKMTKEERKKEGYKINKAIETKAIEDIEQLSAQEIEEMFKDVSQPELEDRYTALMTGAAERKGLGSLEKEITFQAIQKELRRREEINIQKKIKESIEKAKKENEGEEEKKKEGEEDILAGFLSESLDSQKRVLDSLQTKQQKRRTNNIAKWVTAATAGGLMAYFVGSQAAKAAERVTTPETEVTPETTMEAVPSESQEITNVVEVKQGDNIYKLVSSEMDKKGAFDNLDKQLDAGQISEAEYIAQKENMIMNTVEKIKDNPQSFGISSGDANIIQPGEKLDFSSLITQDHIAEVQEQAAGLTEAEVENINNVVEAHETFVENGGSLTPDNIEKIDSAIEKLGDNVDILKVEGSFDPQRIEFAINNPDMAAEDMEKVFDFGDSLGEFTKEKSLTYQDAHKLIERLEGNIDILKVEGSFDPQRIEFAINNPDMAAENIEEVFDFGDKLKEFDIGKNLDYQGAHELINQGAEIEGDTLRIGHTIVDMKEGNLYNKDWISPFTKEPMRIPIERVDMDNINSGQILINEAEKISADVEKEILSIANGETVKRNFFEKIAGVANKITPEQTKELLKMDYNDFVNSSGEEICSKLEIKLPLFLVDKRPEVFQQLVNKIQPEVREAVSSSLLELEELEGMTVGQVLDKVVIHEAIHKPI